MSMWKAVRDISLPLAAAGRLGCRAAWTGRRCTKPGAAVMVWKRNKSWTTTWAPHRQAELQAPGSCASRPPGEHALLGGESFL